MPKLKSPLSLKQALSNFKFADYVSFAHAGVTYEGYVHKINKKTITVAVDDFDEWLVSPFLITKIDDSLNI